ALGGSSYTQIWTSAVWRIATPIGAGAIHPISLGPAVSTGQSAATGDLPDAIFLKNAQNSAACASCPGTMIA
ncbi:hypothetical protein, partial [Roseovarius marisflavi]|uniref:hypothetical protein n=1 Tax=Roseovarius marisflavi TaxID=1054996 RepID=UPI001C66095B